MTDFKFNSYGEGEQKLKELGFVLKKVHFVYPASIPEGYPPSESEALRHKQVAFLAVTGGLTLQNGDDPVISEYHDKIREGLELEHQSTEAPSPSV